MSMTERRVERDTEIQAELLRGGFDLLIGQSDGVAKRKIPCP